MREPKTLAVMRPKYLTWAVARLFGVQPPPLLVAKALDDGIRLLGYTI